MEPAQTAKDAEEEQPTAAAPSLFPLVVRPLFGANAANSGLPPPWLSNRSFNAEPSIMDDAGSSRQNLEHLLPLSESEEESETGKNIDQGNKPQSYELVESSSDGDSYGKRDTKKDKSKKKEKKRRMRSSSSRDGARVKTSRSAYDYDVTSRKPNVPSWAPSTSSDATKNYYFDSHGDRDNLAFGCLYRMDVARFKLSSSIKSYELYSKGLYQKSFVFDGDSDTDGLDNNLKATGRYWCAKYSAIERHKNLKRIRIMGHKKSSVSTPGDFIPLLHDESSIQGVDGGSLSRPSVVEESWEDEVLRKTREFNKMLREHPHDEKVWLGFSDFQDKVASMQPQKGARLQTLEKKISILEKATELNPENEQLLLCLLNAYQSRDGIDAFIGRWEKVLIQHSGSYKLWKEFLRVVQGEFSRFKVSEMRKMYANAIRALSSACRRQCRQVHQTSNAPSLDLGVVQQELGLVDIFVGLCRFEWQTGYQELATALFQAQIEYGLFCPSLLLTEQSKHRLFEHFWSSNGARIGEDGALGWATWLEKEEEQRERVLTESSSSKNEEGGWTGWSEPLSKSTHINPIPENINDDDVAVEELNEEFETSTVVQDDNTEALLKMLGIDSDADPNSEVNDTTTWTRWAEEEVSRDSDQWMPIRGKSGGISCNDFTPDREGNEQLLREVLFEDVTEYLFSMSSEEARLSLVFQFIDFYGGRMSKWTCTNSSSWTENTLCLEELTDSILGSLRKVHEVVKETTQSPSNFSFEFLLGSSNDIAMRTNMMKFLRNATLLFLAAFPRNYILEEAALVAEELLNTKMGSCGFSVTPCRALAKSLVKSNRQDVLLCGVYARREAAYGNIDHARKVFDMALASIEGLSSDLRSTASLLYFWYADMELGYSSSGSESSLRAVHILCCLGSGVKYSPFKCQASSLQQLRAHQGFKERIKILRSAWARGVIDDHSTALICSAALFEELTAGGIAGIEVLNQAFCMVLPERRSQSYQLEFLFEYYVKMLWRHRAALKVSDISESIVQGLQIFPSNPQLYYVFVEISCLHSTPNKLRWIFDNYCQKNPSVITLLFALSFEISIGGSHHRIRGLFERGLGNEKLRNSVILWRCYIAYEVNVSCNLYAARRIFFRAIHACPRSKKLWLDGFLRLHEVLSAKELSDLQEVMRDKELNLRTDIYEILLQDKVQL